MDETTKRTRRENLAMKIMILRDRHLDDELTDDEALEQAVTLITEYEIDANRTMQYPGFPSAQHLPQ